MDMDKDNLGSSVPLDASVYRFPPVRNLLDFTDTFTGVAATVVHEVKAFRDFNPDRSLRAFLVNLRMHIQVTLDPTFRQILTSPRFLAATANPFDVSVLAERLQIGYVYLGSKLVRARGVEDEPVFAPQTTEFDVSDTQSSSAGVAVNEGGATVSFGVTETVVVSLTEWVVALGASSGQLTWDYYLQTPVNVKTEKIVEKLARPERLPNNSTVGFSFDTTAWLETTDPGQAAVELQPVFKLQVGHFERVHAPTYEGRTLGDENFVSGPYRQPPLKIDLTRVPDRSPRLAAERPS